MLHSAIDKTKRLAAVSKFPGRAVHLCTSFAADRRSYTTNEYALALGGIALGGSGIALGAGMDISQTVLNIVFNTLLNSMNTAISG